MAISGYLLVFLLAFANGCSAPNRDVYTITVYTGGIDAGGTDANVYITLIGPKGRTRHELDNVFNDDFERNAQNHFVINGDKVGKVESIIMEHDNSGSYPGWFLEKVLVYTSGKYYTFNCHCWLTWDRTLSRHLY